MEKIRRQPGLFRLFDDFENLKDLESTQYLF